MLCPSQQSPSRSWSPGPLEGRCGRPTLGAQDGRHAEPQPGHQGRPRLVRIPKMRGSGAKVQTPPHCTDMDTSLDDDVSAWGPGVSREGECGPTAQLQGQAKPSFRPESRSERAQAVSVGCAPHVRWSVRMVCWVCAHVRRVYAYRQGAALCQGACEQSRGPRGLGSRRDTEAFLPALHPLRRLGWHLPPLVLGLRSLPAQTPA